MLWAQQGAAGGGVAGLARLLKLDLGVHPGAVRVARRTVVGAKRRFTLAASHAAADSLPLASTCFNTLKLPAYPSAAALRAKLGLALAEGAGFDEAATAEQ